MSDGDFYGSEKSALVAQAGSVKIELAAADGTTTVLKAKTPVQAGEIIDASVLSKNALRSFIEAQIADAKANGVLFSVHLKATMMKVSDPIIFGHVVSVFYKDVLAKHAGEIGGGKLHRFFGGGREHERANAVARFDDPRCLQTRNRLADHGAAHGQLLHHRDFGGDAVAWPQRPAANLIGKGGHHLFS